jgi:hypothetical protein
MLKLVVEPETESVYDLDVRHVDSGVYENEDYYVLVPSAYKDYAFYLHKEGRNSYSTELSSLAKSNSVNLMVRKFTGKLILSNGTN